MVAAFQVKRKVTKKMIHLFQKKLYLCNLKNRKKIFLKNQIMEKSKIKIVKSLFSNLYKLMVVLSPFGLLLSIVFFIVQGNESARLVENLKQIEQSLSTRHIGIFPDYLDEINLLLAETPCTKENDSKIVIFQDVLFYGMFYNGAAFKEMIKQIAELSSKGKRIVIAYYDNSNNMRKGQMFREVVQESWMHQSDLGKLSIERSELMRKLREQNTGERKNNFHVADSIVSEKYFVLYRDDKSNEFGNRVKKILTPMYDMSRNDYTLFKKLDEIKNRYLNKSEKEIHFCDMYDMYQDVTNELKIFFEQHNVKLIPLDNYLTMTCWSNGEKVLFAFPGRYGSDEIGFLSQDVSIMKYIDVMLEGIENIATTEETTSR